MILIRNATLLNPASGDLTENVSVVVEGERIREVSPRPIQVSAGLTLDAGGRVLMPGLIDCHVHVFLSEVNIRALEAIPLTLMTARGAALMRAMLDRGFTTVRDTGGADWGIREGVAQGYLPGPRLFVAGRPIGQTGGHSDARRRTDASVSCHCCNAMAFTLGIADGVDEVRRAAREQLRQGVDHIKIMVSGGVASPYDPLESLQYTTDEIRAAVEEAAVFKRYVCAHAYAADAIARAVQAGVRVIEHGNLIDAATAKLMASRGAFLVPTLVAYDAIQRHGGRWGMGADSLEKNKIVMDSVKNLIRIECDGDIEVKAKENIVVYSNTFKHTSSEKTSISAQTQMTVRNAVLAATTNRWNSSWKPKMDGKGSGRRRA